MQEVLPHCSAKIGSGGTRAAVGGQQIGETGAWRRITADADTASRPQGTRAKRGFFAEVLSASNRFCEHQQKRLVASRSVVARRMQHKVCGLQFGSAGTTLAAEGRRRAASPLGACHLAQTPRAETQGGGAAGQGGEGILVKGGAPLGRRHGRAHTRAVTMYF